MLGGLRAAMHTTPQLIPRCTHLAVIFAALLGQVHSFIPFAQTSFGIGREIQLLSLSQGVHTLRKTHLSDCKMIVSSLSDLFKWSNGAIDEKRAMYKQQLMDVVQLKQSKQNRMETEKILELLVEVNTTISLIQFNLLHRVNA